MRCILAQDVTKCHHLRYSKPVNATVRNQYTPAYNEAELQPLSGGFGVFFLRFTDEELAVDLAHSKAWKTEFHKLSEDWYLTG